MSRKWELIDERTQWQTIASDCFGSELGFVYGDSLDFKPADDDHDAPFMLDDKNRAEIARALTGDVVATYPERVFASGGQLFDTKHEFVWGAARSWDWEDDLCEQLDRDGVYELTVSLRRVK